VTWSEKNTIQSDSAFKYSYSNVSI